MALARQAGRREYGRTFWSDILVCAAILADVPGDSRDAEQGSAVLACARFGLFADGLPVCRDDRARAPLRAAPLILIQLGGGVASDRAA